jgi:hypothetical protein
MLMLGTSGVSGVPEVSGTFGGPGVVVKAGGTVFSVVPDGDDVVIPSTGGADGLSVKIDVGIALETVVGGSMNGVVVTVGTLLVDAAEHCCCGVIRSLINVTAPVSAYSPPFTLTPSRRDIEVKARILPLKVVELPSVADEPT